jgi:Protein of unknown function (DUF3908)
MGLTYLEFKEYVQKREFGTSNPQFRSLLERLSDIIIEEEIEFFYPKNIFNTQNKEFIIFLNDKIMYINSFEEEVTVKVHELKINNFEIDLPKYDQDGIQLTLNLVNGSNFVFNSKLDSTENWNSDYVYTIKHLMKMLIQKK